MELVLFAPPQFPLDQVAQALLDEGVSVFPVSVGAGAQSLPAEFEEAVLIFPEQDVVFCGEQTARVRGMIGGNRRLIVCAPVISPSDRTELVEQGASDVIAPRSRSPLHVAERILAEMILTGCVQPASCGAIRGATAAARQLYRHIEIQAKLHEPVLILGETGVGKELVAKELHDQSGRAGKFLPINSPAINRDLFESELFGHEKGAFTNAHQSRDGLLAAAGEGTVFLDEIGDLHLETQAMLLRVIEDHQVRRVGSNTFEPIQARIVAATNQNLEERIVERKFRQDLFMRLQGFTLHLPPLRERRADLPLLVHHFVAEFNKKYQVELGVPPGALDCLFRYEWPGNVRELRSAVWKSAAYADRSSGMISAAMLQEAIRPRETNASRYSAPFDPAVDAWSDVIERAWKHYSRAVLALERGNKEAAAKRSGLSRSQFYEKLKGIKATDEPSE